MHFENKKCQFCNVLGDEFHFLFECSMYNYIRHIYLQYYLDNGHFADIPTLIKFIYLSQLIKLLKETYQNLYFKLLK